MRFDRCALIATLAVALAGTFGIGSGIAASSRLPIYPGAVFENENSNVVNCGHAVSLVRYNVGATNIEKVADWYAQRMAGAVRFDSVVLGSKAATVFDSNGANAVNVTAITDVGSNDPKAKGLLHPHIDLVLLTYSPPISSAGVQLAKAANTGDKAAAARMMQMCKAH
jgi:hypothetical protein